MMFGRVTKEGPRVLSVEIIYKYCLNILKELFVLFYYLLMKICNRETSVENKNFRDITHGP
jgi:hypothetical protein